MAWLRQLGEQAECGCGATLCLKFTLIAKRWGFPTHSTYLMSLSQANWWPSVHLRGKAFME